MLLSFLLLNFLSTAGVVENTPQQFPNLTGASGIYRSYTAIPNPDSTFGTQVSGSFFYQDPFIDNLKDSRSRLRLAGNYTFGSRVPVEVFGGTLFSFNENSNATSSRTMTTYLENTDLGVRVGDRLGESHIYLAGYGHLRAFSGTRAMRNSSGGATNKSGPPVSGILGVATTFDFEDITLHPRAHLNLAYRAPNSNLSAGDAVSEFNRFGTDSYKYHAMIATAALELTPRVWRPYVEYSMEVALSKAGDPLSSSDNRHTLGLGLRVTPYEFLNFIVGTELGFFGPHAGKAVGVPRNPTYDIIFGVSFQAVGNRLFEQKGTVQGRVSDSDTNMPLSDVKATLMQETGVPVQTDITGRFEFAGLPNGSYQLHFEKTGYVIQTRSFTISRGDTVSLEVALVAEGPKTGDLEIALIDAATKAPIERGNVRVSNLASTFATGADGVAHLIQLTEGKLQLSAQAPDYLASETSVTVLPKQTVRQTLELTKAPPTTGHCVGTVKNSEGTPLSAVIIAPETKLSPFGTDPMSGAFDQSLPAGSYRLKIQAENYLPLEVTCTMEAGQSAKLDVVLEKPKQATLVDNKIVLPDAIYFEFNSGVLKKASFKILDQVATILKDPATSFTKLDIDGHTDSVGDAAINQKLSEKRSQAVRSYLIKKGLPKDKLAARGFGLSKPVATNQTAEGRAENRRVEFNLVRTETE